MTPRDMPDWMLSYLAPIDCMRAERAEACRRFRVRRDATLILFLLMVAHEGTLLTSPPQCGKSAAIG